MAPVSSATVTVPSARPEASRASAPPSELPTGKAPADRRALPEEPGRWTPGRTSAGRSSREAVSSRGPQVPAQLATSVALGPLNLALAGTVTEQVALSEKHALVTSNDDRKSTPDLRWSRITVAHSVAMGFGVGPEQASKRADSPSAQPPTPPSGPQADGALPPAPPAGPPSSGSLIAAHAAFGFSRGAQLSAIVPSKSLGEVAANQARALSWDLGAENVAKLTPGTEFALAEQPFNLDASASYGASVALLTAHARAGVSASISDSRGAYSKHVVVERDGRVSVGISKFDERQLEATAGVNAGLQGRPSSVLGGATHESALDQASGGRRASGAIVNSSEPNMTNLTFTIGAARREERSTSVRATLDLKTAEGRAAYEYLMAIDPEKLEGTPAAVRRDLQRLGTGVAYVGQQVESGVSANLAVGEWVGLAFSSRERHSEGELLEAKREARGGIEAATHKTREYSRVVKGALPRWFDGEEREVRMGLRERQGPDGRPVRSGVLSMKSETPRLSEVNAGELVRFAKAMGRPLAENSKQLEGAGTLELELSLTSDGLAKLERLDAQELKAQFERALKEVTGEQAPWTDQTASQRNPAYRNESLSRQHPTVEARFREAATAWRGLERGGNGEAQDQLVRDYQATTGRSLQRDLGTAQAMGLVVEGVTAMRGKSLEASAPLLATIGSLAGRDLRSAALLLKNVANAQLEVLEFESKHEREEAEAEAQTGGSPEAESVTRPNDRQPEAESAPLSDRNG